VPHSTGLKITACSYSNDHPLALQMIIFHIKMLIKTIDPRERNLMIYRRDSARISNQKKRSNKRLSGLLKDMPHA